MAAAAVCEMRAGSSHRIGILFGGCSADRPLIAWRRLNLTETTHIRRGAGMKIESPVFGTLEVSDDRIIEFPAGCPDSMTATASR